MNTKNKTKQAGLPAQAGFIDLILLIIGALILMRYYNITVSDAVDWVKDLSLDKVIGWFKDLVDWVKDMMDNIGANPN